MDSHVSGTSHFSLSSIPIKPDDSKSLLGAGIQLNDRQLKLLAARRASKGAQLPQKYSSATSPTRVSQQHHPQLERPDKASAQWENQKTTKSGMIGERKVKHRFDTKTVASTSTAMGYWAQGPTSTAETLPTTWSESAESVVGSTASSSSGTNSFGRAARQFYGQRLTGREKKLYDDTGATWNDSRSEASAVTAAMSKTSQFAASEILSETSHKVLSHKAKSFATSLSPHNESCELEKKDKNYNEKTRSKPRMMKRNVETEELVSMAGSSVYDKHESVVRQDSSTLRTESESEGSLEHLQSQSESLVDTVTVHSLPLSPMKSHPEVLTPQSDSKPSRIQMKEKNQSLKDKFREKIAFKGRDPKSTEASASLLRNLLKHTTPMTDAKSKKESVTRSPKHSSERLSDSTSDASNGSKKRFSVLNITRSPRSASDGSNISKEDVDRMKRFASRASNNPRRENFIKSQSTRMKEMFTSKLSSSVVSPTPDNDRGDDQSTELDSEPLVRQISEQEDSFDASMLATSPLRKGPYPKGRGRRSSVRMKMVTSQVMNDLIEENVILESDEEDDYEDDQPTIQKSRSIKSLPDIVKENEIEISKSSEMESNSVSHAHTDPPGDDSQENIISQEKSNVAHATQRAMEQISSDEPEGYTEFVSRLKSELADSHTKLFDQFHTMIRCDGNHAAPLSMYPGGLDLKTKEIITKMSTHVKRTHSVEFQSGSQMTSDKDIEKVRQESIVLGVHGKHFLHPTKPITQSERTQPPLKSEDGDLGVAEFTQDGTPPAESSGHSMRAGCQGAAFEVTLSQHIRKSILPSPKASSDSRASFGSKSNSTQNLKQWSTDSVAASSDSVFQDGQKQSNAKPPKGLSPKMFVPPSEKQTIAWSSVKLRSVADKSRENSAEDQIPASWTKVRLRKVTKETNTETCISASPDDEENDEFHRIVFSKTPKGSCNSHTNLSLKLAPSAASTDVSGTDKKPIDVMNNGTPDEPIKLSETRGTGNRPIKIQDNRSGTENNPIHAINEGSVMISLVDEDTNHGKETKLLLNKKGMMKIEAIPGESRAEVLWHLEREDIKSALMNMSSFSVKLIVSSEGQKHKDLRFPNSEQCKKFANALHDLLHGSRDGLDDDGNVTLDDSTSKSENSIYVEQLSEDEQRLLEEFRHRKKVANNPHADFAKDFLKIVGGSIIHKPPSVVDARFTGPSSPLSEISHANSTLSGLPMENDRKLLQMKISNDAFRHKIIKDQTEPQSVSAPLVSSREMCTQDDKIAESYRRMLKMGVPAEAVRHKMQKDRVEANIMAAVFVEDESTSPNRPIDSLSTAEEAVAETYIKMLKMMIPKEAVQHKMIRDGVDPKILTAVIGQPQEQQHNRVKSASLNTKLTDAEECIASAYRKMLKLSIPKDAVRHKMTQEGISERIMTAVLGANVQKSKEQMIPHKRGSKPGFHWCPIADDESIAGSVWSKAKPSSDAGMQKSGALVDISKHVEMFQKQPDKPTERKLKAAISGSDSKEEMAKLIDLNRANNVAITLKAFNDFSHRELAGIIEFLDPHGKIKGDRALFMKDLLPATAELKAIKSYQGCEDRLVTAEKWFKRIVHIKRIEEKIEVMRIMETFKTDAIILGKSFQLLTKVCNQVMDSDRLPDLLDMVRQIGNTMNEGRGEAAAGFKLDFLPRLAQTKGSDKKTTALDLVVMLFHVRNQRSALMLSAEIPDCQEASRIQLSDLLTDVRTLEGSLRKCQKELDSLKKELSSEQSGRPPHSRCPVASDTRSEIVQTIDSSSRSSLDEVKSDIPCENKVIHDKAVKNEARTNSTLSPRGSLLAALHDLHGEGMDFSLDASIRRLEKFVTESSYVILPRLEAERDEAVEGCKDLSSFFCEAGGERVASNLLKILDEFASGIDRAVVKYDHQKKAEERKRSTQKRKSLTGSKPPAPERSNAVNQDMRHSQKIGPVPETSYATRQDIEQGEKKSLVLMVNEMLKMAGDQQVKDFMEGVVYANPDDRFKKIYQAELARKDPLQARREMISAIKAMDNVGESKDTQQAVAALSDLRSCLEGNQATWRREQDDKLSDMPSCRSGKRRSRTVDRWTQKVEDDSYSDINDENNQPLEKTGSVIRTVSSSAEADESRTRRRKRQSYMERWASRAPVTEATVNDLDTESDVGAFENLANKQRKRALDRWSRKPNDKEEIIE